MLILVQGVSLAQSSKETEFWTMHPYKYDVRLGFGTEEFYGDNYLLYEFNDFAVAFSGEFSCAFSRWLTFSTALTFYYDTADVACSVVPRVKLYWLNLEDWFRVYSAAGVGVCAGMKMCVPEINCVPMGSELVMDGFFLFSEINVGLNGAGLTFGAGLYF